MTQSNTEALTIYIARRMAMHYKESQQAAIVQTAEMMPQQSDNELTKKACLDLIAASPIDRLSDYLDELRQYAIWRNQPN